MKAMVTLSYSVRLVVEGEDENQIQDWLASTTPDEAYELAFKNNKLVEEVWSEEIVTFVRDDSDVDIDLNSI